MKRSAFFHLIGLATAGLFCSVRAPKRAEADAKADAIRRDYNQWLRGVEGAVPKVGPPSTSGCLPEPTPSVPLSPMPATRFGMFSDAGNRRVWKFTEEWAFPSTSGFDFEAFEKDVLSVRRDHPEVFDTAVREAIFQYWENAITHSPLLNRANHIATLQGAFDLVLVTSLSGAPDYGMSTSYGNHAVHLWAENFEDKSVDHADQFAKIAGAFPEDFERSQVASRIDLIHDLLFERFGREKAKAMLDVMARGVLAGHLHR
jgi:hypothetical protein